MPDPKKPQKKKEPPKGGYNQDTVASSKEYLDRYYKSQFFKNNLLRGQVGWPLGKGGQVDPNYMSRSVLGTNVKISDGGYSHNDRSGNINVNRNQDPNEDAGLVITHELGHTEEDKVLAAQPRNVHLMLSKNKAYKLLDNDVKVYKKGQIDIAKDDLLKSYEDTRKLSRDITDYRAEAYKAGHNPTGDLIKDIVRMFSITKPTFHDDSPNEIRSDVLGLRYLAQKNKIWDPVSNPGEVLDQKKFEQIMNMKELNKKEESIIKKRLKHRFDDNMIKYFLQNIAANKSKSPAQSTDNNV